MAYAVPTRIKCLEAGIWCGSDGRTHRLHEMHDTHLVNAFIKAVAEREPRGITDGLATEIVRRGLRDYALEIGQTRHSNGGP